MSGLPMVIGRVFASDWTLRMVVSLEVRNEISRLAKTETRTAVI